MRAERTMCEIVLQNPRRYRALEVASLEAWLGRVVADLAPEATSFAVRLVDDEEMRQINHQYRDRDVPTDVLSFPGEESAEGRHLGDVAVSIPTARQQAQKRGHSLQRELRLLLVHGILHCIGYDHEADAGEMDRLEAQMRRRWVADVD